MNHLKKKMGLFLSVVGVSGLVLAGCGASEDTNGGPSPSEESSKELNIYSSRQYDTDQELYKEFEAETGVKINVLEGKGDELLERLKREGEDTEADLFITADAGMLHKAKSEDIFAEIESEVVSENIPEKLIDSDNKWVGLTKRARLVVYNPDKVDESELSTYEDLSSDKWNDDILIRSSTNIYNQSLVASLIELNGEESTREWAEGIVANMARDPEGGDRDQIQAVASGEGNLAVVNSYYLGKLLTSSDPEEVKAGESVDVFFPNQDTTGTHINISGAGVIESSDNKEIAVDFIEFLTEEKSQEMFAGANMEYPANPDVEPSDILKSWGDFKEQDIKLSILGERNQEATMLLNSVGWK